MAKRIKWNRRRSDNLNLEATDYALVQDSSREAETLNDDELSIPNYDGGSTKGKASHPKFTSEDGPHIIALTGSNGGVGTTSLATQLAHQFAITSQPSQRLRRRAKNSTVCLIDLDFEAGACAHHLDLFPSLTLKDLCGPADQIDKNYVQDLISMHESGIALLAAPNSMDANRKINPHTIMAILDAAADVYDTVIIDLPRYQQAWTLPVMRSVDMLGLVCELTIPSLHATKERLNRLSADKTGPINTQVILNKCERRSFKNTLNINDAKTALECPIYATLFQDPDTLREALNSGEPAGAIRQDTRFVKDVQKLSAIMRQDFLASSSKAA